MPTREGAIRVVYVLERSPRARRLQLTLGEGRVVILRLPKGMTTQWALRFLMDQGDWVRRAWQRRAPRRTLAEHLRAHPEITLEGKPWRVARRSWPLWRARLRPDVCKVELVGPADGDDPEAALAGLLRELAAKDLPRRVERLARRRELKVAGVTVRDQVTRWASCSCRKWISLNWRLILLPPRLQDHVIWHELAHLRHMHHRPSFWALLASYDPSWERHDRLVTAWGRLVMQMGRGQLVAEEPAFEEVARDGWGRGR